MGWITGKSTGWERNRGARPGQSVAAELELLLVVAAVCRKSWVAGDVLCFLNTKMILMYFCLCIYHLECACGYVFLYIHTHTYLPTSTYTDIRMLPQPASFCKLQKYRQKNKIKFLIIAKSSETSITVTGHFFPELSPLQDSNLMILSVALYILLFIRNNSQSSLDSICRAAESSAAERW